MADLTTESHVAVAVVAAVAGAAVVAVAAPVIGATIGGWLGWKAGKPDEATIQKLKS